MIVKIVDVSTTDCKLVQRTQYELDSYREIIKLLGTSLLESNCLKTYSTNLSKLMIAFDNAKSMINEKYIPDEYRSDKYSWSLDYLTDKLYINTVDEVSYPLPVEVRYNEE